VRREIVDWEFQAPSGEWLPAVVPGCIHTDLLRHGLIPEPFADCNERELQWIGEREWNYRTKLRLADEDLTCGVIRLCFDGLDTIGQIELDGRAIADSDGMFGPVAVPLDSEHRQPGEHILKIEFRSTWQVGKEREARLGGMEVWNGDPSRVYVRKAQYQYGWDWGPTFITCGIWRRVWLEATECIFEPTVNALLKGEEGLVDITWLPSYNCDSFSLEIEVLSPAGIPIGRAAASLPDRRARVFISNPVRWGETVGTSVSPVNPQLYRVVMRSDAFGEVERRIGFRTVELRQDCCFDFWVNGNKLFCGGANWIPADSFPTRVTPDRYRELLTAAKEAGMSMIRVWGGGIYEEDHFYDLCDELELLVWQDFMFACGMYPAGTDFLDSVRNEATAQLRRLIHHPCIALWCGNNEDYQIAGSRYREDERLSVDSQFPARVIYESVLPQAVRLADSNAIYVPGSPFGGPDANSPTIGDRHVWEVWHGKMAPYQDYPKHGGLFVSEFGMGSYPDMQTLEPWIEDRSIGSESMRWHHKALGGDERIAHYLSENFPEPNDSDTYAFYTQLVQAEAMRYAYEGFRRDGSGGALVWQLNDCWPTISWSIIDYDLRPKPAYYAIKRALRPIAMSALLEGEDLRIAVMNGTQERWHGNVTSGDIEKSVECAPMSAVEVSRMPMSMDYVDIRLTGEGASERRVVWREPLKHLTQPTTAPLVTLEDRALTIAVTEPTAFLWVQTDTPARWTDNLLHLLPGESKVIRADRSFGRYRLQWVGGATDWRPAYS